MIPKKQITTTELPDDQQVLDSLLMHLPAHVYWKDVNGVYLGCNDCQAQSLGLKRGIEVIGKTDFELPWNKERAKRFWENDCHVIHTAQAATVEELAIVDGEEAIVLSLKVPLKNRHGQVVGVLGISVDITQQKRTEAKLMHAKEAAEAAYHAKMEFLEHMRHDLRTPMVGIRGCTQAIRDCIDDPNKRNDIKEYAQDLDISSNALLTILNTVIESIQVANGGLPICKKRFYLDEQLTQVIQLNQAQARHKKLTLNFNHDRTIPCLVGDSDRIQRIVLELVTNALNFTTQGSVTLSTELAKRKGRTVVIKINVQDTGMGIPAEVQQDLFTRFKRLTPAYQGMYTGTGLGLSIIKQLVDDIDGEIYFESQSNQGTLFTCIFSLKVALLDECNTGGRHRSIANTKQGSVVSLSSNIKTASFVSSHYVLLVEDNVIAAKVTAALLTKLNCVVDVAHDAKSALDQIKQHKYHLILMDIGLPDGNGEDVSVQIRQDHRSQNQHTPIVAVTAHVDDKSAEHYHQSGINRVLVKPLSEEVALKLLQKYAPDKK